MKLRLVACLAANMMLTSCGNPAFLGVQTQTMRSAVLQPPVFTPLLYAGGPNTNVVDAYPAFRNNPNPVAQITSGLFAPTGMAVDNFGNVYVCNNAGQGTKGHVFWTVTVYARAGSSVVRTYTDGVMTPTDVSVGVNGTVYVANLLSAVTVYPRGSVHPSLTLQTPPGFSPVAVASDDSGNVFVSYVNQSSGAVYEYGPGQTQGKNLGLAFTGSPHGLVLDERGNLILAVSNAPSSGSAIDVYAPGAKSPKLSLSGPFQPFMVALSRKQGRLFAADYGSGNNDGGVYVYAYPSGKLLYKDTAGAAAGAYGVAVDPRAAP